MAIQERSHYCGRIRKSHLGREVVLKGWVRRRRDLGALIFVDLRDREGIVQCVFSEDRRPDVFARAKDLRPEYVIGLRGTVRPRGEKDVNPSMATGALEVEVEEFEVYSTADTPPFAVENDALVSEEMRLKYRYLDLRRPFQNRRLQDRSRLALRARRVLAAEGFIEIETPFLTKSTPEGARDFLVPSRMRKGAFYALPQSPQLFKQLCMVAGFDRYFQIVRCFRDEDLRADRQPEFTQIDIEMSFPTEEAVMGLAERLMDALLDEADMVLTAPVARYTYDEAMDRWGCDKPDTRFGMEISTVSGIAGETEFGVFRSCIDAGGAVRGFAVPGMADLSRKDQDLLNDLVKPHGGKGVLALMDRDGEIRGPAVKHIGEGPARRLLDAVGARPGDLGLFVAATYETACACLSALRLHFAQRLDAVPANRHEMCWIHRFPAFEWSGEDGRWYSRHHPFTMPREEHLQFLPEEPEKVEAQAYDLVLDGHEIAGGSIRIHRSDIQQRVFRTLGFTAEESVEKFGFLLDAFRYGTPPHGGIAFGFDRLAMILLNCDTIRDVIAFPKTTSGLCLMTESPGGVDAVQMEELGIVPAAAPDPGSREEGRE